MFSAAASSGVVQPFTPEVTLLPATPAQQQQRGRLSLAHCAPSLAILADGQVQGRLLT
jgi:hypothetical protein